jgi:hypothetical protein
MKPTCDLASYPVKNLLSLQNKNEDWEFAILVAKMFSLDVKESSAIRQKQSNSHCHRGLLKMY